MRSGGCGIGIDARRFSRGLRSISWKYKRYRDTGGISGSIEKQYGKFQHTWLMDRGIPTENTLEKMRSRGIDYLVGTPKGHLTNVEKQLSRTTPNESIGGLSNIQMIDIHLPTTDGRHIVMSRYTQPDKDVSPFSSTGIVASRSTTAQGLCLRADRAVVPTFSDDPLYLLA